MKEELNVYKRRGFLSKCVGISAAVTASSMALPALASSDTDICLDVVENLDMLRNISQTEEMTRTVFVQGHSTSEDGGHGIFRYVSGLQEGTYQDNDGTIILPYGGGGSSAWLRVYTGPIHIKWFGAKGNGYANDQPPIQKAINVAIEQNTGVVLDSTNDSITNYRIEDKLIISGKVSIIGDNPKNVTLLCDDTSGLEFEPGVKRCTLSGFGIATVTRHYHPNPDVEQTPNNHNAISFRGDSSSWPEYNTLENLFIDGFYNSIVLEWAWETTITNIKAINCEQALKVTGKSVNNYVYGNSFQGKGILISLGDGSGTVEGWQIYNNFFDGGRAFWSKGASYCKLLNNIIDHVERETAILVQSTGGYPSIGFSIIDNYIAFSGDGHEGIRLLNNIVSGSAPKHGHIISENIIFSYPSGSLLRGILLDGTEEHNNIIKYNKVTADVSDCVILGAESTLVTGNFWLGGGFSTNTQCLYKDNIDSTL